MSILLLVRNFVPAHEMIERGDWHVSEIARNAFDLEGKVVGTIGAGRIGYRVLQRLVPFDCKELLYYDYAPLPAASQQAVKARRVEDIKVYMLASYSTLEIIESPCRTLYLSVMLSLSTALFMRVLEDSSMMSCSLTSRRELGSSTPLEEQSVTKTQLPAL